MSNDLQTNLAGELWILSAHGSYYLEPDELAARIDRHLEDYYLYLGKSISARRDQDFGNITRNNWLISASVSAERGW
jgi:hypothetical protein